MSCRERLWSKTHWKINKMLKSSLNTSKPMAEHWHLEWFSGGVISTTMMNLCHSKISARIRLKVSILLANFHACMLRMVYSWVKPWLLQDILVEDLKEEMRKHCIQDQLMLIFLARWMRSWMWQLKHSKMLISLWHQYIQSMRIEKNTWRSLWMNNSQSSLNGLIRNMLIMEPNILSVTK